MTPLMRYLLQKKKNLKLTVFWMSIQTTFSTFCHVATAQVYYWEMQLNCEKIRGLLENIREQIPS